VSSGPKVIRRVVPGHREGRGLYWRPNGQGYTNSLAQAGLYDPEPLTVMWRTVDEIDAASACRTEIDRLQAELDGMRAMLAIAGLVPVNL